MKKNKIFFSFSSVNQNKTKMVDALTIHYLGQAPWQFPVIRDLVQRKWHGKVQVRAIDRIVYEATSDDVFAVATKNMKRAKEGNFEGPLLVGCTGLFLEGMRCLPGALVEVFFERLQPSQAVSLLRPHPWPQSWARCCCTSVRHAKNTSSTGRSPG